MAAGRVCGILKEVMDIRSVYIRLSRNKIDRSYKQTAAIGRSSLSPAAPHQSRSVLKNMFSAAVAVMFSAGAGGSVTTQAASAWPTFGRLQLPHARDKIASSDK